MDSLSRTEVGQPEKPAANRVMSQRPLFPGHSLEQWNNSSRQHGDVTLVKICARRIKPAGTLTSALGERIKRVKHG